MIISILAEPRSGSTNLANWFYYNTNFTTLFEPFDPLSNWYKSNIKLTSYKYDTPHLCIKETYYPHTVWNDLIPLSNKIIVLYRENKQEQLESFLNSIITNNWESPYKYTPINSNLTKEKTDYFNELKAEFKKKYISDTDYFKISYEELYYGGGFQKVVDYIDLECVQNKNFPIGKKYRITAEVNKLL